MPTVPVAPLTVLIADPDINQQQELTQALNPRFRVATANDLAETMRKLTQLRPSVLLIDLDQPDSTDVKAFIKRLRDAHDTHRMVIGIITRRNSILDKISGFNAGADDYLVKPVNLKKILHRVVLLTRTRQLAV